VHLSPHPFFSQIQLAAWHHDVLGSRSEIIRKHGGKTGEELKAEGK